MERAMLSDHQVERMQEFADTIDAALDVLQKYEVNHVSIKVSDKLQEAMQWFHTGILNHVLIRKEEPISEPVPLAANDKS